MTARLRLRRLLSATTRSPTACRPTVPTIRRREPIWAMTVCGTPARNRVRSFSRFQKRRTQVRRSLLSSGPSPPAGAVTRARARRYLEPPSGLRDFFQILQGIPVIRLNLDGAAIFRDRIVGPALPGQHEAETVVRELRSSDRSRWRDDIPRRRHRPCPDDSKGRAEVGVRRWRISDPAAMARRYSAIASAALP